MGRSRGGITSKVHMLCDALGYPLKFSVTGGNVHDIMQAEFLLEGFSGNYVIADKGYDSVLLVEYVKEKGFIPVIPSRRNRREIRSYDKHLYKERNVVERTFNKLKQFRRIATRYEKRLVHYMALLHIAAIILWLK